MPDRFGALALALGVVGVALYAAAGSAGCPDCGSAATFLGGSGAVVGPVLLLVGAAALRDAT
ncbi:hypothetical protein [Halocalculus aciditolerans]|uniref:Uncharacterized protein n=1 Tax=Halocalculus aciditolerans TaxID=1383812 RepID=A0A830FDR1_9EURY|nr:hypothetical protein [Halocalculus aciditolerans]GGL64925.1 hypothetical protein GCM10009039_23610 [Halocalculus aciditolerans]